MCAGFMGMHHTPSIFCIIFSMFKTMESYQDGKFKGIRGKQSRACTTGLMRCLLTRKVQISSHLRHSLHLVNFLKCFLFCGVFLTSCKKSLEVIHNTAECSACKDMLREQTQRRCAHYLKGVSELVF